MRQALDLSCLPIQPKEIRDLLLCSIHHYHRDFAIRVEESSREQRTPGRRTRDSLRALLNELRKVSDVVIRVRVDQLAGARIGVNRRETEILDLIRPAGF